MFLIVKLPPLLGGAGIFLFVVIFFHMMFFTAQSYGAKKNRYHDSLKKLYWLPDAVKSFSRQESSKSPVMFSAAIGFFNEFGQNKLLESIRRQIRIFPSFLRMNEFQVTEIKTEKLYRSIEQFRDSSLPDKNDLESSFILLNTTINKFLFLHNKNGIQSYNTQKQSIYENLQKLQNTLISFIPDSSPINMAVKI